MGEIDPDATGEGGARRRDRTFLGVLLGAGAGILVAAILQQAAIAPPERIVVFGCLGLGIAAGAAALAPSVRSARAIGAGCVAVGLVLFAATGWGAWRTPGGIQGGCELTARVAGEQWVPSDTSATSPLVVPPDAVLDWSFSLADPVVGPRIAVGVVVGGATVVVAPGIENDAVIGSAWNGSEDVGARLLDLKETTGLDLRGVVHVRIEVEGSGDACRADFFVAVRPSSAVDGSVLAGLWLALAADVAALVALRLRARRRDA